MMHSKISDTSQISSCSTIHNSCHNICMTNPVKSLDQPQNFIIPLHINHLLLLKIPSMMMVWAICTLLYISPPHICPTVFHGIPNVQLLGPFLTRSNCHHPLEQRFLVLSIFMYSQQASDVLQMGLFNSPKQLYSS
jgi:hypothetical protein